ncbi:MAG: FecR domain-containing protein [Acidobacteriota bacterium]|nr:MAG: FecR domain-containing protein [Acidobacteriota bacterium]
MRFSYHRISAVIGLSAGIVLLAVVQVFTAVAQNRGLEARISGISGGSAIRQVTGRGAFPLRRGDEVAPGDEIDTRGGARVLISMSDGSVITILPGTRIVLKDFRGAGSLRELIDILIGRVRIKVNRIGGRPNPARVNTPSASIAVRGTEFGVIVLPGETSVAVYEGLVEVINRFAPDQRVLVEPGQAVTVRQNENIRFFVPGPGSEIGDLNERRNFRKQLDNNQKTAVFAPGITGGDFLRNQAGEYQRQIQSIVEPGETPPLPRFLAYAEPFLDSQENPAFASGFRSVTSRVLFLASARNLRGAGSTRAISDTAMTGPFDYGALSQASVFVPIGESRFVLGGHFTHTLSSIKGFDQVTLDLTPPPSPVPVTGERTTTTRTSNHTRIASLMLARGIGPEERTSLGIGFDYVQGSGTLKGMTSLVSSVPLVPGGLGFSGINVQEELEARSDVSRTRFRIGMTHLFGDGHRLSTHYHRGAGSAGDRDRSRTFNGLPLPLDEVELESDFYEIGMRLRGPVSKKLYYGIESSWIDVAINQSIRRSVIVPAHDKKDLRRALAGAGLGYILRPGTLLSFDVAAGVIRIDNALTEDSTANPLENRIERKHFVSMHLAAQSDLWKGFFAGASVLGLGQRLSLDRTLYPDRFGRRLTSAGLFAPDGLLTDAFADPVADLNFGLRMKKLFVLQYVYTTDFGRTPSSHILMVRFDLGRKE